MQKHQKHKTKSRGNLKTFQWLVFRWVDTLLNTKDKKTTNEPWAVYWSNSSRVASAFDCSETCCYKKTKKGHWQKRDLNDKVKSSSQVCLFATKVQVGRHGQRDVGTGRHR
jgi:hypothetical protein